LSKGNTVGASKITGQRKKAKYLPVSCGALWVKEIATGWSENA
jgi:hypothetical protein